MATIIRVADHAGNFAENKDVSARIRDKMLVPALSKNSDEIILDFDGVEYATQSFIHSLLAKVIRTNDEWLGRILFNNCTEAVQGIIEIVVDYAQETD